MGEENVSKIVVDAPVSGHTGKTLDESGVKAIGKKDKRKGKGISVEKGEVAGPGGSGSSSATLRPENSSPPPKTLSLGDASHSPTQVLLVPPNVVSRPPQFKSRLGPPLHVPLVSDGSIRLSSSALVHSSIRDGSRHSNDPPDDRVSMDTDVVSASPSADMQLDIPAQSGRLQGAFLFLNEVCLMELSGGW